MEAMRRAILVFIVPVGVLALPGCALFEKSAERAVNAVTPNADKKSHLVAVGAERRVVFQKDRDANTDVCSEPPPDVAQSFTDQLKAALTANLSKDGDGSERRSEVDASVARTFATAISQIYVRSQGVQLFRDGAFMLCQAHMNGALFGDKEVRALLDALDEQRNKGIAGGDAEVAAATKRTVDVLSVAVDKNYSVLFKELLSTAKEVLTSELPHLYRHTVVDAAAAATTAAASAKASASLSESSRDAAVAAEGKAESARKAAAKSASDADTARQGAEAAAKRAEAAAPKT